MPFLGLIGGFFTNVKVLIAIGIALVIGALFWYYSWSQNKIETLTADKAALELSVKTQKATIGTLTKQRNRDQAALSDLNDKYNAIEKSAAELEKLFTDNHLLTGEDAAAMQKAINDALAKLHQEIEKLTDPKNIKG